MRYAVNTRRLKTGALERRTSLSAKPPLPGCSGAPSALPAGGVLLASTTQATTDSGQLFILPFFCRLLLLQ